MKLCFIADADSIHTRRWVAPLLESGVQAQVVSYKRVNQPWPEVDVIDLTRKTSIRKARFLAWGLWLRQFLRQQPPDILHAHQVSGAGWLGAMAGYHPFVVSAWGSDLLVEPSKSWFRRRLITTVLRKCDRLIVPAPLMLSVARNLGLSTDRIALIPWGIETEVFRPTPDDRLETRVALGIDPSLPVVFSPRGIAPIYNHDTVLLAAKTLAEQGQSVVVLLLRFNVDRSTLQSLEQAIAELGLEQTVRWLEPQASLADMAKLYRMSDVVMSIPSSEGYGFTVYEAMSCGCPVVMTDLPLFAAEMAHGVHVLKTPVRDVAKTAEALAQLLTDASMRQRLVANAAPLAQAHSVARRTVQAEALYREITRKQ